MIQLKPARRQAYRYGKQIAELLDGGRQEAANQVSEAYVAFIRQFDAEDQDVTRHFLHNEYLLGLKGAHALSGIVATYSTNHVGDLIATYTRPHRVKLS